VARRRSLAVDRQHDIFQELVHASYAIASSEAPGTTSTMRWLVSTLPTATAAGESGFSTLRFGVITVTG
jgi:hypothetical protein